MTQTRAALAIAFNLFVLIGRPASADWLIHATLPSPTGISVNRDRILVFGTHSVLELAPDGTARGERVYSAGDDNLQIEHVTNAREGFIATGVQIAHDDSFHRPVVVRLSATNDVTWARSIDATWSPDKTIAVETSGGDIVAAIRLRNAMLLVRFSANGEARWSRVFDRTDVAGIKALVPAADGGVLVLSVALTSFAALTRIDASGKVMWDRIFGTADAGFGLYDAVELEAGGFLAVGRTKHYNTQDRDGWLVRISPRGDVLWEKTLGGDSEDGLYAFARMGANEFTAVGETMSAGNGEAATWIVSITADGVIKREIAVRNGEHETISDEGHPVAAVSEDGDSVFASPVSGGLLVGRIRSASPACDRTRAISMHRQSAAATKMDVTLVERDAAPVIRPVVVISSQQDKPVVTTSCTWTAVSSNATPQSIAVEAPDEESIEADAVARLLVQQNYGELDRSALALRTARSTFASGRSKLRAFYQTLGRHHSLFALGEDRHRHLLEEWRDTTHSATSATALASWYSAAADRIRGTGFVETLLDADADRYQRLSSQAIDLLSDADKGGQCDAPCYDLMLYTARLGAWSEPLEKLIAADPTYWEAFGSATLFAEEKWGGRPGDIQRFVESWSSKTKIGDELYAFYYAGWERGLINTDHEAPPPPDWARMRAGFSAFQSQHPKSRDNAHRFAAAAYRAARDLDTARMLFKTPLLTWSSRLTAWRDRFEYERASAWALGQPVEPFFRKLAAAAPGPVPGDLLRLVAPAQVSFHDGTMERTNAFLVIAPTGPMGITATTQPLIASGAFDGHPNTTTSWILDRDVPLPREAVSAWPDDPLARFTPPPSFATTLHAFKPRSTPIVTGDRLYVVACSGSTPACAPRVTEVLLTSTGMLEVSPPVPGEPIDWTHSGGAPVLDETGALAGVLLVRPGKQARILPLQNVLRGDRLSVVR